MVGCLGLAPYAGVMTRYVVDAPTLVHLVDERERWPVQLGTQEESTVLDTP